MGGGKGGSFGNTKGRRTLYNGREKSSALANVNNLLSEIQKGAKSFFKSSSNNYNKYSVIKNKDGTYTVAMENPGSTGF